MKGQLWNLISESPRRVPRAAGVAGVVRFTATTPPVTVGAVRRRALLRTLAGTLRPDDVDAVPPAAVALGITSRRPGSTSPTSSREPCAPRS